MTAASTAADQASPASGDQTPKAPRKEKSGSLGRYLAIRALLIIPTVWILVTTVFVLMRATGDPITAAQGGRLPEAQLQERIHQAGYDRPILTQYVDYLGDLARGDFGTTISDHRPVTNVLTTFGGATLELAFYALIVAFVVGIPLGRLAAFHRDKAPDAVLRILAILAYATPVFFAGLILKLVFAVWLDILPVAGRADTKSELRLGKVHHKTGIYIFDALRTGEWPVISSVLLHAVLPAIALGLLTAGVFLRLVRTNVISTFGTGYVEAARSRGVPERRLLRKHAYRPALIPIITVVGLEVAMLLGGAVLTETTFEWKGLGFQLAHYLQARDFVAVQGIVALLAVIVAVTNFVVDVIAAFVDPRVRY